MPRSLMNVLNRMFRRDICWNDCDEVSGTQMFILHNRVIRLCPMCCQELKVDNEKFMRISVTLSELELHGPPR